MPRRQDLQGVPRLPGRLFPVVLTDNGACFSNPEMIENARAENNPYKLIPRTKVFYCDAYCSSQKPHVERFHVELRRILVKGTSFNSLDQEKVAWILSNLNSYTRGMLDNATPYDEFVKTYGDGAREFLSRLGIERIPSNQVTLDPILLGERFKPTFRISRDGLTLSNGNFSRYMRLSLQREIVCFHRPPESFFLAENKISELAFQARWLAEP